MRFTFLMYTFTFDGTTSSPLEIGAGRLGDLMRACRVSRGTVRSTPERLDIYDYNRYCSTLPQAHLRSIEFFLNKNRIPSPQAEELSVGEVAARNGIAISAIHYYESRGLIKGWRSSGNQRR